MESWRVHYNRPRGRYIGPSLTDRRENGTQFESAVRRYAKPYASANPPNLVSGMQEHDVLSNRSRSRKRVWQRSFDIENFI
jgi:hypothetical protein